MRLSWAHALVSRTLGFSGISELQRHVQNGDPRKSLTLDDWVEELRVELGGDFDELVSHDECANWFRQIYGPEEYAVEAGPHDCEPELRSSELRGGQ